jgi:hypothetical protein
MNKPEFFIFGVPDGFNLFQGNADSISYFQNSFYDRSKEKTKLVIHRKVNGQVSYSYLKYRFLSCEDRAGAFFGMSIVFNGEYCKDTAKLYRFFEFVYHDIILEDNVLLEEIKRNPNAQGKFLLHTFNEQEANIRIIENTVLVNIRDNFANDILPFNSSFVQGKANLVRKINAKQNNKVVLEALQTYSWISISPDYPEGDGFDEISEEGKKALIETADKIKDAIIENYKALSASVETVRSNTNQLKTTVTNILDTIQTYIRKQPELQKLKEIYLNIQKQLGDLISAIPTPSGDFFVSIYSNNNSSGSTVGSGNFAAGEIVTVTATANKGYRFVNWTQNGQSIPNLPACGQFTMPAENVLLMANFEIATNNWLIYLKKYWKYAAILVGIIVLGTVVKNLIPDNSKRDTAACPECQAWLNQGDSLMNIQKFSAAKIEYKNAEMKKPDYIAGKMEKLNAAAITFGKQAAQAEFDKNVAPNNLLKIDCYNAAISELNKWKEFDADNEIPTIQVNYLAQTIEYYEKEIKKPNTTVDNKKKYANIIVNDLKDMENTIAKSVLAKKSTAPSTKEQGSAGTTDDECYVSYKTQTKKASAWLTALETELKDRNVYDYVIGACTVIINNCPQNKTAAQDLKSRAEEKKRGKASVSSAFNN